MRSTLMQHPLVGLIEGDGADEEATVREAYSHVAAGYEAALRVTGLSPVEQEDLRACLRAALALAGRPRLSAAQERA